MSVITNPTTLAIGSPIGSGTSGSVLYIDSNGLLAQDNPVFNWNDSTKIFLLSAVSGTSVSSPTLKIQGYNSAATAKATTLQHVYDVPNAQTRFTIQGPNASGSLYLFENGVWQFNSPSTFSWNGGGFINILTGSNLMLPLASVFTPLIVRGVTSQSATLQEWQNVGTTPLAQVNASGYVSSGTTTSYGALTASGGTSFAGAIAYNIASVGTIVHTTTGWGGNGFLFSNYTTGSSMFSMVMNADTCFFGFLGASSLLSNPMVMNSTGLTGFGATPYNAINATVHVTSIAAGTKGFLVQAAASPSVNIVEVQTSGTTVLVSVGPAGDFTVQPSARTTGSPNLLTLTGPAHTTLTASTEAIDANFNLARTVQFATGALATQRAILIQAPTYAFVGASTLTTAVTMEISGAPIKGTNATFTNAYALRVLAGQATATPLVIKGAASQSADLQQWQNSSGTGLVSVGSGGVFTTTGQVRFNLSSLSSPTKVGIVPGNPDIFLVDGLSLKWSSNSSDAFSGTLDTGLTRDSAGVLRTTSADNGTYGRHIAGSMGVLEGTSSDLANVGGTIFDHYADAGNVGSAQTDLYSDTISANTLHTDGDKLEAQYGGTFVSSATDTREIRISFAGTVIFDSGKLSLSLSSAWTVYVTLIRKDSATIRYMISLATEGAALSAYTAVGELGGLDFTTTNILKITGQSDGVTPSNNDIVAEMGAIYWMPAA